MPAVITVTIPLSKPVKPRSEKDEDDNHSRLAELQEQHCRVNETK